MERFFCLAVLENPKFSESQVVFIVLPSIRHLVCHNNRNKMFPRMFKGEIESPNNLPILNFPCKLMLTNVS